LSSFLNFLLLFLILFGHHFAIDTYINQSPLFLPEQNGTAPKCPMYVHGRLYKRGYYLIDGIYPTWSVFVKATQYPTDPKDKRFKKVQESARKDVERGFGILKAKWGILKRPLRAMSIDKIRKLVYTCMILHNMILKDDGNAISPVYIRDPPVQPVEDDDALEELHDPEIHHRLRYDITEHLAALDLDYLDTTEDEDEDEDED